MTPISPSCKRGLLALTVALAGCSASTSIPGGQTTPPANAAFERIQRSSTKGFELLYAFENAAQGKTPFAGVFVDKSGDIYGGTESGGANNCGAFLKLTPANGFYTETILHSFNRQADGCSVFGTPVANPSTGDFYMTLGGGGAFQEGTAVELSPGSGGYQDSAVFSYSPDIGYAPFGQVVLVGSTVYSLAAEGGPYDSGSIVGLTQVGLQLTALHPFNGHAAGAYPDGGLVADAAGSVYGTTLKGGSAGYGVVFKFTPNAGAGTETVLWNFQGGTDGSYSTSDLLIDTHGNIYGVTSGGGTYDLGTVFKLTPKGGTYTESILHSFGGSFDGADPWSGLTLVGKDLWGTTTQGGSKTCACGTIFSLSTSGAQYKVRHSFAGSLDGAQPIAKLFYDGHALYGTAYSGGSAYNGGAVYRFIP